MARKVHWPEIAGRETGYGITWVTCAMCNRDRHTDVVTMTSSGPVCDECYTDYALLAEDGGA